MNLGEYRLSALLTWDGAAADALRSLHASLSAELDAAEPIAQATTVSTTIPAASAREALYRIAASLKTPAPYMLMCHASPLPRRRKPPIAVLVAGKPRSNALAKDSEWIRQVTLIRDIERFTIAANADRDCRWKPLKVLMSKKCYCPMSLADFLRARKPTFSPFR
jgi:hypothetical protein